MAAQPWQLEISEVLDATGGTCSAKGEIVFTGLGTDTRRSLNGQLFVALKGDRFDAHDFILKAAESGAKGILVHRRPDNFAKIPEDVAMIEVKDTLLALQELAKYWRKKWKFKVLAVTGSNGKTSTKEFSRAMLENHFLTHASHGSFNNHWGVPLSLLAAGPDCEVVIQEMGMNHSGELTRLAQIAEPDVTLVTMVGQAHIGELGSQEAVAQAKEELYLAAPNSMHIFNIDNEWTRAMWESAKLKLPAEKIMTFSSFSASADVNLRVERMSHFSLVVTGTIGNVAGEAVVPVMGRHNVVNLMAAASMSLALRVPPRDIWQDLTRCRGAWGRNQLVHLANGAKVVFDGYNANPESMLALLRNLYEMEVAGKKLVILGAMMELGKEAEEAHFNLGTFVGRADFDVVWFFGPHAADFRRGLEREGFQKTLYISDGYEESLAHEVGSMVHPSDIAVIKGSRAMQMERVLELWRPVDFATAGPSHE